MPLSFYWKSYMYHKGQQSPKNVQSRDEKTGKIFWGIFSNYETQKLFENNSPPPLFLSNCPLPFLATVFTFNILLQKFYITYIFPYASFDSKIGTYYYLVWDFIITSSFFQKFYFSFWFWRITVYLPQIFYCSGNEKKPPATSFLRKEYNIAIFFGLCNFNSSFLFHLDWTDNHWEKSWVGFYFFQSWRWAKIIYF